MDESEDRLLDDEAVPDGEALHAVSAAQTTSVEPNQETAEPAIESLSSQTIQQNHPHCTGRHHINWGGGLEWPG